MRDRDLAQFDAAVAVDDRDVQAALIEDKNVAFGIDRHGSQKAL
jgi:hypothetical protein